MRVAPSAVTSSHSMLDIREASSTCCGCNGRGSGCWSNCQGWCGCGCCKEKHWVLNFAEPLTLRLTTCWDFYHSLYHLRINLSNCHTTERAQLYYEDCRLEALSTRCGCNRRCTGCWRCGDHRCDCSGCKKQHEVSQRCKTSIAESAAS